jgi:Animal haem peroxidase
MKKPMSHGAKPLRGLESTAQSTIDGQAKFGRMFRWLEPAHIAKRPEDERQISEMMSSLADKMVASEFNENVEKNKFGPQTKPSKNTPDAPITVFEKADENRTIPAGYTYFGQFVDHDVTFDPASSLQQQNDPDALVDFRTPRLDLDCLYGRGPADEPHMYQKDDRVLFTVPTENKGFGAMKRFDLPRAKDDTALIGDKRNDENKIVSQIQALFLEFHNKVYDNLKGYNPGEEALRFAEAQRVTRWTYQYIVLTDYVKRIVPESVYTSILPEKPDKSHKGPHLNFYKVHGDGFIPVEFAVAAYRFGHSMVRPSYSLNDVATSSTHFEYTGDDPALKGKQFEFGRIPIFAPKTAPDAALNGFGSPLPDQWGIDWSFFFGPIPAKPAKGKQIPQPSYRIDATLVDPLGNLPEFAVVKGFKDSRKSPIASLAFRNLMRGFRMGLPSGQRIAQMMGVPEISDSDLWGKKWDGDKEEKVEWEDGTTIYNVPENKKWLQDSAPLWFYVLKEAELTQHGHRLGEVGGRIVAETLFGLVWADHYSYLFQRPDWQPWMDGVGIEGKVFDMHALTSFVHP